MDIHDLGIKSSSEPQLKEWLAACYAYARRSKHPSTHNAALIIRDNKILLEGVNNLPPGVKEIESRFQGDNKHMYLNHAERDVIYKACRAGIATEGLTMVMPWLPCIACTNAVITSGIATLIVHKQMLERTKERWREELENGVQLLKEAGVSVVAYDGIVEAKAYMHGQEWNA